MDGIREFLSVAVECCLQKLWMWGLPSLTDIGGPAEGQVVVVTGPTSGIGRETAAALAARGAHGACRAGACVLAEECSSAVPPLPPTQTTETSCAVPCPPAAPSRTPPCSHPGLPQRSPGRGAAAGAGGAGRSGGAGAATVGGAGWAGGRARAGALPGLFPGRAGQTDDG